MGCRRNMGILLLTVVLVLLIPFPHKALAQECELNCNTKNCSPEGICICDIPSQDSLMSGNRNFLGGVFCDAPAVMCDGTNSFWCESGGICNELVQGENYTCTCPAGFAGDHCNLAGLRCGDSYCYNGGTCPVDLTGGNCDCPPEFLGSKDCALLTPTAVPSATAPELSTHGKHNGNEVTICQLCEACTREENNWLAPFSTAIAVILSISCVVGLALKCHRERLRRQSQTRFQELRQVQMNEGSDFYDDGEDDLYSDQKHRSGKAFP